MKINKHFGSTKGKECLGRMSDCQLVKKDSALPFEAEARLNVI
jgi:hypothetical protein